MRLVSHFKTTIILNINRIKGETHKITPTYTVKALTLTHIQDKNSQQMRTRKELNLIKSSHMKHIVS